MSQLKPKSMASALILGALVGVGIWAGIASAMPQEGSERGIVWKDGAEVYAGVCVYCHEQMLRGAGVILQKFGMRCDTEKGPCRPSGRLKLTMRQWKSLSSICRKKNRKSSKGGVVWKSIVEVC